MNHPCRDAIIACSLAIAGLVSPVKGADWPTWRADSARSGYTPHSPSLPLSKAWVREFAPPAPAWPAEQGKIQFDASYEPVIADGRLFVPSMVTGEISAYELATGKRIWIQYCDAAVRFAPLVWKNLVIVASDDGSLHAFNTSTGERVWRFQGAPQDRWQLGNDRLVSMWPARGAPVVHNDVVYFAAGIWPFMGVFIYGVDPVNGEEVWANTNSGSRYLIQPHNSPAFAGIAPQGYLAANDKDLLVSGGRTPPACFDITTGAYRYYRPGDRSLGKSTGGFNVMLGDGWHSHPGGVYGTIDGTPWDKLNIQVVGPRQAVAFKDGSLRLLDPKPKRETKTSKDKLGKTTKEVITVWTARREARLSQAATVHIQTNRLLWAEGKPGEILAFDLDAKGASLKPVWTADVKNSVWRMIATDTALIAVTRSGELHCFVHSQDQASGDRFQSWPVSDTSLKSAAAPDQSPNSPKWLIEIPPADGYSVVLGYDQAVVKRLQAATKGRIIVVEGDARRAYEAREQLAHSASLGKRVDVVRAGSDFELAPYFADLVVCTDPEMGERLVAGERVLGANLSTVRPYGGVLMLPWSDERLAAQKAKIDRLKSRGFESTANAHDATLLRRVGGLPGAAGWTHQNGDIGNSVMSRDTRVKGPLGVLWFGGPSHTEVLPRHGHGPTPQVLGGRLYIEGPHMLRAVDVYTGRILWQRDLPDLGLFYDNTGHHPGAGAIGGNFVTTEDSVYVVYADKCLRLSVETGSTLAEFRLPKRNDKHPFWGFLGIHGDYLIAGVEPSAPLATSRWKKEGLPRYGEGSRGLAILNRKNGKLIWQREAKNNFRHNAIVAGGDLLYCIDQLTSQRLELVKRRGQKLSKKGELLALELATGKLVWRTSENVFGTWLGYSQDQQVLLEAGSPNRDRAKDEVSAGMTVYRAQSGDVIWSQKKLAYGGPCMLLGERIITQGAAYGLLSGERLTRPNALTAGEEAWAFTRTYGCNTAIGCPNMLTFRSAAAGYYDLANDGGTGNWGGFRSSCTNNLIPADGVLNAPDYTRTCACAYQNQCSLALIHMPDVEVWTFRKETWSGEPVEQLGINFAAPGDRLGADGTLWLDFPSVGGGSPNVPIKMGGDVAYLAGHSLTVPTAKTPNWIRASGVVGAASIRITLDRKQKKPKRYDVELIVRRNRGSKEEEPRVGRVEFQLQGVKNSVDLASISETGRTLRFEDVAVTEELQIDIEDQAADEGTPALIVCGIRVKRR